MIARTGSITTSIPAIAMTTSDCATRVRVGMSTPRTAIPTSLRIFVWSDDEFLSTKKAYGCAR